MNTEIKFPVYARISLTLIALYLCVHMMLVAQPILLPLIYATIIAILISPLVNYLTRKRIHRGIAISGVLLLSLLIIAGLITLISLQAHRLSAALPQLAIRFQELLDGLISWFSSQFNVSASDVNTWITNLKADMMSNSGSMIGITLTTVGGTLATLLLTPVYTFMILLYQPHLITFIHKLFGAASNDKVNEVLTETRVIIRSYLVGLFTEIGVVAVLNIIGLLIIGIDYAILLGLIGALLNVIPYLGAVIAMALFMVFALITESPIYILYILAMYGIIQFIDNNILVPRIVGSKVKLNALTSLLAVIAGAAIWGIPGMFLSIPITAILKVILDRVESLHAIGFLLGDTTAPLINLKLNKGKKNPPA